MELISQLVITSLTVTIAAIKIPVFIAPHEEFRLLYTKGVQQTPTVYHCFLLQKYNKLSSQEKVLLEKPTTAHLAKSYPQILIENKTVLQDSAQHAT